MNRPKELNITMITLLLLLGASAVVAIMIFRALGETIIFQSLVFANPAGKHFIGKVDVAHWKKYSNKTAGFALRYPNDWYIEEIAVDKKTGGDVLVDGAEPEPFEVNIFSPIGFGIAISHEFSSYDNQPMGIQKENTINLSRPLSGAYYELKSVSGAPYLRSYKQNPGSEEDELSALVPTGKYIIAIQAIHPSKARDIEVFDAILKTLELK